MCLNHMSTKAKLLLLYEGGYFVSLRCKDTSFFPFKSHHCKVKSIYRGFLQVNEGFKPFYKANFVGSRCKPRRFMMQTPEVLGAY